MKGAISLLLLLSYGDILGMDVITSKFSLLYIKNRRTREMIARIRTNQTQKNITIPEGQMVPVGYAAEIICINIWSPRRFGPYAPPMNVDLGFLHHILKGYDGIIILDNSTRSSNPFGRTTKITTDVITRSCP